MKSSDVKKGLSSWVIILLMFVALALGLILNDNLGLESNVILYNILGSLSLMGFLYSHNLSKRTIKTYLDFGINRREFFRKYLLNVLLMLGIMILFIAVYILVYELVFAFDISFLEMFKIWDLVFLLLVFLLTSFLGLLLGTFKLNIWLLYVIIIVVAAGLLFVFLRLDVDWLINLISLVFISLLLMGDYLLIKNIKI